MVAGSHQQLATLRIPASPPAISRLLGWAQQFPQRRWAVENARGLGCHLTRWLLARGETVQDVPTTATARVRELSRGRGRKTDALDAAAAAAVAAVQGDAATVQPEDATMVLAVLEERRSNLVGQRTRSVNQLHAVLRELIAGGAPRKLRADRAAQLLRAVCPATAADRTRKQGRQGLACSAVGDAPSMTVLKEGRRRGPNAEPPVRSFGNARTCAADGCATRLSRYNPAPCCYRHEGWDLEQRTRPRRHGPESPLAPDHGRRSSCGLSASSSTRACLARWHLVASADPETL